MKEEMDFTIRDLRKANSKEEKDFNDVVDLLRTDLWDRIENLLNMYSKELVFSIISNTFLGFGKMSLNCKSFSGLCELLKEEHALYRKSKGLD